MILVPETPVSICFQFEDALQSDKRSCTLRLATNLTETIYDSELKNMIVMIEITSH